MLILIVYEAEVNSDVVVKLELLTNPILLLALALSSTILLVILSQPKTLPPIPVARSFILWLHGLGDSGLANEPMEAHFTSPQLNATKWSFPAAPSNPVTCRDGNAIPSWFDIVEIPVTANSPKNGDSVLKAVQMVHAMIDKEITTGTNPDNIFVCGFSQEGGAIFSGWVPFNSSITRKIPEDAKKTLVLWSHGMDDKIVLFEAGQAGPLFLQRAGFSCEFKAYPSLGHSLSTEVLQYLESWIGAHLRSSS